MNTKEAIKHFKNYVINELIHVDLDDYTNDKLHDILRDAEQETLQEYKRKNAEKNS